MSVYILGTVATGALWLVSFLSDEGTPKTDVVSWLVIGAACILWPLAVPLSCVELLTKTDSEKARFQE
ncbi:MAG: hypothetical protein AAGA75_22935 [Cyanobacteria bacterium P01_E01_bin.6]